MQQATFPWPRFQVLALSGLQPCCNMPPDKSCRSASRRRKTRVFELKLDIYTISTGTPYPETPRFDPCKPPGRRFPHWPRGLSISATYGTNAAEEDDTCHPASQRTAHTGNHSIQGNLSGANVPRSDQSHRRHAHNIHTHTVRTWYDRYCYYEPEEAHCTISLI